MAAPKMSLQLKLNEIRSQSDSSLVRWSVLAIALIAIWVWVVEPLHLWTNDLRDQVDRNADKAARMIALEKNAGSWITAQQDAQQALSVAEQQLFVASSDTQAQAEIQVLLQRLAQSRRLNIESQKLIPADTLQPLGMRLAIEVGLRGDLIDVLYLLDDVSQSEKLLIIDRWIVQIDRTKAAFVRFTIAGIRPVELEVPPSAKL